MLLYRLRVTLAMKSVRKRTPRGRGGRKSVADCVSRDGGAELFQGEFPSGRVVHDLVGQVKAPPNDRADLFGMAERCLGLALPGGGAGIPILDGVGREDGGRLSQPRERRVSGQEQIEKILQVMSAGDELAKFLKEGLEVFLGRLLTMKADRIVQGPTAT